MSGAGAERETGVPVLDSKRQVESRIRAARLPHTILAPVYLMENALNPWNLRALHHGKLAIAVPAERRLQQVATADVAASRSSLWSGPRSFAGSASSWPATS